MIRTLLIGFGVGAWQVAAITLLAVIVLDFVFSFVES